MPLHPGMQQSTNTVVHATNRFSTFLVLYHVLSRRVVSPSSTSLHVGFVLSTLLFVSRSYVSVILSRAGACSFCVLELFCNAVHSLFVPRVVACCCVFLFSNVVSCCYPSVFSCPVLVRVHFVFSNFVVLRTLSCRVFSRHLSSPTLFRLLA
jgi:hypothetical protein